MMVSTAKKATALKKLPEKALPTREIKGQERRLPGVSDVKFYRIEIRPSSLFVAFRTQDVGEDGHLERLAGKKPNGKWATATWLVAKEDAHVEDGVLVINNKKTKSVLKQIRGPILHKKGDLFTATPREDLPEGRKPTPAQKKARQGNIKKAQAARWKNKI